MKIILLAVGTKMPSWVTTAFEDYQKRFPKEMKFELQEIPPCKRFSKGSEEKAKEAEAKLILEAIPKKAYIIALDERGKQYTSIELSKKVGQWQQLGCDVVLLVGGPNGLTDEIREKANIAFDTVLSIVSYPGTYYSYIFEDVAIDHTLYALGWNMSYLNSEQCDAVYSKKDFVAQYMISAQKADKLKHLVLKGSCTAENHTKLVSASKTSYGNPVTWTLSEEDKEIILLGNDDSNNAIRRITAELPKIPVLPDEEKRDPAPPADIRRQKEILEKTMNALLGVKEGD